MVVAQWLVRVDNHRVAFATGEAASRKGRFPLVQAMGREGLEPSTLR